MHQFLKFILFRSSTLHVSDGLSVHHQESKAGYTLVTLPRTLTTYRDSVDGISDRVT